MRSELSENDDSASDYLIDELADEFVTRKQAGLGPSISEYCRRYPELEDQIRQLFPMLTMLENAKTDMLSAQEDGASPPEQIGDYVLLREIGRGGMGIIYEARHSVVGRTVALKVLPQRLAKDQRALARFEREARAIAGLHHTNVVPLFEFGHDDGSYFLVMQLIDGESLDKLNDQVHQHPTNISYQSLIERIHNRRELDCENKSADPPITVDRSPSTTIATRMLPPRFLETASLGYQIGSALDYAHRRGILHRDVKPSNILLDGSGTAWLTDFGLAKTDDEDLTQTGEFLGTLRYTAPERFHGQCDRRSDVYALGLTLYELLSAQPAFPDSDRLQLIHAIENRTPLELRKLNPEIPQDLATIISKAIEHDPAARYATAGHMADDLQRFLADEPIYARRLSISEKLSRWTRRNRALAGALSILAIVVLLTIVGTTGFLIREAGLRKRAEDAVDIANMSRDQLQQTLYFAEMNLAGQAAEASGGTQRALDLIQHWLPHNDLLFEMRGWEWFYLNSVCHRAEGTLAPDIEGPAIVEICWDPTGTQVAISQSNGKIVIWDAVQLHQLKTFPANHSSVLTVDWSPDGSKLASGSGNGWFSIWDVETGNEMCSVQSSTSEVHAVRWSPDSRQVAWGQNRGIYLCDVDSELEVHMIGQVADLNAVSVIQWSPDGTHIFGGNWWQNGGEIWNVEEESHVRSLPGRFVVWETNGHAVDFWLSSDPTGRIQVWDSNNSQPIQVLIGHTATVRSLAWSPDSSRLLSTGDDRSLRIWDLASGNLLDVLEGHEEEILQAVWEPTERRVASVAEDGAAIIWNTQAGATWSQDVSKIRIQKLGWNDEDTKLACMSRDGLLHILKVSERSLVTDWVEIPSQVESLQWSPDGRQLATGDHDAALRIWDANTGAFLREFNGHTGPVIAVDWHPDGQTLCSTGVDMTLRWWNLTDPSGPPDVRQRATAAQCLRWNNQGDVLATGDMEGTICLWSKDVQDPVLGWKGHRGPIIDMAWSPDGRLLATGGVDDMVRIWNIPEGSLAQVLQGHHGPVWGVDWNSDSNRLATSSRDGTIRIWEPVSGSEVLTLRGIRRGGEFWCVRWSHDGRQIAGGSADGTISLWDANLGYTMGSLTHTK